MIVLSAPILYILNLIFIPVINYQSRLSMFRAIEQTAVLPTRDSEGAAGYNLYAFEPATVVGGEGVIRVRTGIAVNIPRGYYGRIVMNNYLGMFKHLCVTGGVINSDYTGEICVLVYCCKNGHLCIINEDEQFAQIIFERILDLDQNGNDLLAKPIDKY
jgi:deoxyuridine 5'-triphosphate nucleotidohydrolase